MKSGAPHSTRLVENPLQRVAGMAANKIKWNQMPFLDRKRQACSSIILNLERIKGAKDCEAYAYTVISEILGHSDVHTTLKIYQHVGTEDFRAPLNEIAGELLCDVTKSAPVN